ncbi:MAG: hypothetical protein J5I90_11440 [Caldilineales bacterium]|nr:hypothetical protein [Caldilineales bacterium]
MDALFHSPGFLGTSANLAADATLVFMLMIGAIFTFGAYLAKKAQSIERKYEKGSPERAGAGKLFRRHRWVQTTGGVLSTILVLWMMILPYRDFVAPGIPALLGQPFFLVTTIHALVGFFAFMIGIYVVLRGNKLLPKAISFDNYKPWMRTAYVLYIVTILLGVAVYVVWFVTNPNPPVYG